MFRSYEDPWKLEDELEEKKAEMETAQNKGNDPEDLIDLYLEIEELKERVNFAWQDQEYDEMYSEFEEAYAW